jgi:mannose-6-phosphate isomerase-like protein (cupin superfamily)
MFVDTPTRPIIARHADHDAVWFGPNRMTITARAEDTGGAYALIEAEAPAGSGPPLHVHHDADEAFWILSGAMRVVCGDEQVVLGAGDYALLPRGVPHTFVVEGAAPARLLNLLSPGGSEAFFELAGRPAAGLGRPPVTPPDVAALARAGARHGIEILGPPIAPLGSTAEDR